MPSDPDRSNAAPHQVRLHVVLDDDAASLADLLERGGQAEIVEIRAVGDETELLVSVAADVQSLLASLSPQETRVLEQVGAGMTNKEIARSLNLSDKTVKNYLANAFQKLRVGRRSHAAALFRRRR